MPDFVLAAIIEASPKTVVLGPQQLYSASPTLFDVIAAPDEPTHPDGVVLGAIIHDRVARFYWNGGRRNQSASEDDFALACKLAFYCGHNLQQMYRLFMRSGLRRSKFEQPRPGGNYALWTLKRAIAATPQKWIRKKRQRPSVATGAKKGRRMMPCTVAALELHRQEPHLSNAEIALRLTMTPKQVRDAIRYHRRQVANNAWLLIHKKGIAKESLRNSGSELEDQAA